jgi:hypothetical protein
VFDAKIEGITLLKVLRINPFLIVLQRALISRIFVVIFQSNHSSLLVYLKLTTMVLVGRAKRERVRPLTEISLRVQIGFVLAKLHTNSNFVLKTVQP